jgi:selenoprotein W-related protein
LTGKILEAYKRKIGELKLIPAAGGCFEVKLDGELVYSKLKTGEFPDETAVLQQVGAKAR